MHTLSELPYFLCDGAFAVLTAKVSVFPLEFSKYILLESSVSLHHAKCIMCHTVYRKDIASPDHFFY